MKQILNEFIIRALYCDGLEHAGFIASAASALLSQSVPPGLLPRSMSVKPEQTESPTRLKKMPAKRLPVLYLPGPVTFPQISFIG
jgi:hypothetical protein